MRKTPFLVWAIIPACFLVTAFGIQRSEAEPIIQTNAINGEVSPGQSLQVGVSWPDKTIENAIVRWDVASPSDECAAIVDAEGSSFLITVPAVEPGPFVIVALVNATDGSSEIVSVELEMVDLEPYDLLQAVPDRLVLMVMTPQPISIYGVYGGGSRRTLLSSQRLQVTSSDLSVVGFVSRGLVQATGPGNAILVATFDGSLQVEIPVTVRGVVVEVAVNPPAIPPLIDRLSGEPVLLAFISSRGFHPELLLPESIRVENTTPTPFDGGNLTQLSDINSDGKLDLLVQISPTQLDLSQNTVEISLSAIAQGGTFIAGKGLAKVVSCPEDLDNDGDVDGSDLARLAVQPDLLDLADFASQFGSAVCE